MKGLPRLDLVLTVFLAEGRKGVWTIIEVAWIGRLRIWDAWTFPLQACDLADPLSSSSIRSLPMQYAAYGSYHGTELSA